MPSNLIDQFEKEITAKQNEFFNALKTLLTLTKSDASPDEIRQKLTDVNHKASAFFDKFQQSLNLYSLEDYDANDNIQDSKIDESINIAYTIKKYWETLKNLKDKHQITIPKPSKRAYSTLQRFIKTYEPEIADELKAEYNKLSLPTHGFDSPINYKGMTDKKLVKYGIIVGTIFLVILLGLAVLIECPTQAQNRIFTTVLALAAASYAATIPGFLKVDLDKKIVAGGALAVFVMVFLLKPAELTDFKTCTNDIEGTVYYGGNPVDGVIVNLIKQNQTETTNQNGNFKLGVDFASIDDQLAIRLTKNDLQMDTTMNVAKTALGSSLDLKVPQRCATCIQKDTTANTSTNRKVQCSAGSKYISDYIEGYSRAATEQKLVAECTVDVKN